MFSLSSPRALAAFIVHICISNILFTAGGVHANDSTITSTVLSTTVVTTSTTTITLGQSTFASTTEFEVTTSVTTIPTPSSTMSGSDVGSGSGLYSGNQFQEAVLNSTNFYRKAYQAEPVTWDDDLASFAQDYAQKCVWEHSGGQYGENLALNYATPTLAIDSWASEEKKYSYSDAKFGHKTGHFTQLVWQNTRRVGCGAVECHNDDVKGWLLVCEYDPPGNVKGAFKQNVEKLGDDAGQLGMGGAGVTGVSRLLLVAMGVTAVIGAVGL